MRARTARAVAMLFGLSLLLTACNVNSVLELLADLAPPPAEAADDGAPVAEDDGAASDEDETEASEQADTETGAEDESAEADDESESEESAVNERCINRNEHVANLRAPRSTNRRVHRRTERRRDADADEAASDDDEDSEEPAEQPAEQEETDQPRERNTPPADTEEPADDGGQSGDLSSVEQQVLDLLNAERRSAGLSPLQLNSTLTQGSRAWSQRMATEGFFEHDTSGNFAENIAYGYPTAAAVHRGWMESEGHRNNRMNSRYTRYGVGVFEQGNTLYYTERFQ